MIRKLCEIDFIIGHAKTVFKKLKENHPDLRGYLVFSSRFGQANLKTGIDLFNEFPVMFGPEDLVQSISAKVKSKKSAKKQIIKRVGELEKRMKDLKGNFIAGDDKEIKKLKDEVRDIDHEVNLLIPDLIVKDDVFVEIRFEQLNFELIAKLKLDPLVSQDFTIREMRSINIVIFRVNNVEG